MEFTGQIKSITKDWESGEMLITLSMNELSALSGVDKLIGQKITTTIKKFRQKRSKDANAYAWVLMQKLAEAADTDKWSVYIHLLQKYSRAFTHMIVKENAVPFVMNEFRTCVDLGEVEIGGQKGHQLQVYYGSSTFDTKEMSVFIDGIVSECKELGIETLPPQELERMTRAWRSQ